MSGSNERERLRRRIAHLRWFAKVLRIYTTVSFVGLALFAFVLMLLPSAILAAFGAGSGTPATAGAVSVGAAIATTVVLLISGALPHLLLYAVAEALLFFADQTLLQLTTVERLSTGAHLMPAEPRQRQRRERFVYDDNDYMP